jgi:hypothetical protein
VGNVARKGPSSAAAVAFLEATGPVDLYLRDNLYFDATGAALSATVMRRDRARGLVPHDQPAEATMLESPPCWPLRLQVRAAADTAAWVLANAGARPWERDAIDRRLIAEARAGGGKIIDFESEVGGLPRP